MSTSKSTDTIYCYKCGHPNASWRHSCENCQTQLVTSATLQTATYKRPLGITLYLGYVVVVTGLLMLAGLGTSSILYYLLWGGVIISAVGVWQMKAWGRQAFLVVGVIGLIIDLIDVGRYGAYSTGGALIGYVVGTTVRLFFLYWLATNGDRFEAQIMTSGYSGTPLVKKLGIKSGQTLLILNAPEIYAAILGDLPDNVTQAESLVGPLDFIQFFTTDRAELETSFPSLKAALAPDGMLWISWPKKTSNVPTDLDENLIREIGLVHGLVDVKVVAVDIIWSGLKFVYRLEDRPKV